MLNALELPGGPLRSGMRHMHRKPIEPQAEENVLCPCEVPPGPWWSPGGFRQRSRNNWQVLNNEE